MVLSRRITACLLVTCGALAPLGAQPARVPSVDTVVVCASDLIPAATRWMNYRRRQGHALALISGEESLPEIKRAIQAIAKQGKLRTVVLIGDAPSTANKSAAQVRTITEPATVIQKWGAEPTFASDNWFGDLDEDGIPELVVGRICASTPDELEIIVDKIFTYERGAKRGLWRRRVNLIAGVGGFGALTDKVLETAAKKFITDGIPAEFHTSMTQASWRSSYSPDPRRFQAEVLERMNEGCLAWVYLGHGRKRELDYYRLPEGGLPILSVREVPQVACREGAPIAVFLSCYAGAFDAEPKCLAEALLTQPKGPVAVIAGSSVTMPYAMTVMGNAMLRELFVSQRATLGEVLWHAKRELAQAPNPSAGQFVDQLATLLSPDPELLHQERLEHVRLFHLLGDPLLRLHYPPQVKLTNEPYVTAGTKLLVEGTSEGDGKGVIELVCRRDRLRFKPASRPRFEPTDAWLKQLQDVYHRANDSVWVSTEVQVIDGRFQAELAVPADAWGPAHVRVWMGGSAGISLGASDVYIQLPPAESSSPAP